MLRLVYLKFGLSTLVISAIVTFAPVSSALTVYSQDFEGMAIADGSGAPGTGWPPNDLSDDGWEIAGIVYETNPYLGPANIVYTYGSYEAANGEPGSIQGVANNEGGPDQGNAVLAKYSDYNNPDQLNYYISASTFQTQIISAGDVGSLWRFTYDAKNNDDESPDVIQADSSMFAYILAQDFITGFGHTFVYKDSTNIPETWGTYYIDILINGWMVGDTLTFGFSATSTNYNDSAVFYDNLSFAPVPLPAATWLFGSGLIGLIGMARRQKG